MSTQLFIGRDSAISDVQGFFEKLFKSEDSLRFVTVRGSGGIGKTKLLLRVEQLIKQSGMISTGVIDLLATANRSELSLLNSIALSLQGGNFEGFFETLEKYNAATSHQKYELHSAVVRKFLTCCQAASKTQPVIILLDTFESVQKAKIGEWLLEFLPKLQGRIGVVLAGRKPIIGLSRNEKLLELSLQPFDLTESITLAQSLYQKWKVEYDLDEGMIEQIHVLSGGHPILLTLAIEWMLDNARFEEIIDVPKEEFEKKLVTNVATLETNEGVAIKLMATMDRRFNVQIMSVMTGWTVETCVSVCEKLARFSFVKTQQEEGVFSLHDEMLWLINEYVDFPETYKDRVRNEVVNAYYDPQIAAMTNPQSRNALVAEKLYYQLFYAPNKALNFFEQEMLSAIESYEFDYCNLLLAEMDSAQLSAHQNNIVNLHRAKMYLKEYRPFEAKYLLDTLLKKFNVETQADYLSRVLVGLGECAVSGCTVIESDMTQAISLWEDNLRICQAQDLEEKLPLAFRQLGFTHELLGQHDKAISYYKQGLEMAKQLEDVKQVAELLYRIGVLYGWQYKTEEALQFFKDSLEARKSMTDNVGIGKCYHQIGNISRDVGKFNDAMQYYKYAEKFLLGEDDQLELVSLYGNMGWLGLICKDFNMAKEYTDKSDEICVLRGFGREHCENLHAYYHMTLETKGIDAALPYLEESLSLARKYTNTFMILDNLTHFAEFYYEKEQWEKIPPILSEMEKFAQQGCGFHVFRGRVICILGDIYYEKGDYKKALDNWKNGFAIIALYGESNRSPITFHDYFDPRRKKFAQILQQLGRNVAHNLKAYWIEQGLAEKYSEIVDICDLLE